MQSLTYLLLIVQSSYVLQFRTSLSVADVAENKWCSTLKIACYSKIYINSKITVLKITKFPNNVWNVNGLNYLLKKLRDTGTTARQPGSRARQPGSDDIRVRV